MTRFIQTVRNARLEQVVFLSICFGLFAANLLLLILGGRVELPGALIVRSAGFWYPGLNDPGLIYPNLAVLAATLLIGVAAIFSLERRLRLPVAPSFWTTPHAPSGWAAALTLLAFAWGGFLAYPPNIGATNFAIQWVYWLSEDAKIRYIAQIFRHVFYEYPHLAQGAFTGLAALSIYRISLAFRLRPAPAAVATVVFIISAPLVVFSGVDEDWLAVTALTLLMFWMYAERRWGWLAVSLLVSIGFRTPLPMTFLLAIALSEAAYGLGMRDASLLKRLKTSALRLAPVLVLAATLAIGTWLLFGHFGRFGEGIFVHASQGLDKIEVEGFTLSRLSGVYILHGLWAFPVLVSAIAITLVLTFHRRVRTQAGRVALASALLTGGTILFYEVFVERQFYYNYRYLMMAFGAAIPACIYFLRFSRLGWFAAFIFAAHVIFLNNAQSNIHTALTHEPNASQVDKHQLYSCRRSFAPYFADRNVVLGDWNRTNATAIQYIRGLYGVAPSRYYNLSRFQPDQHIDDGEVWIAHSQARRSEMEATGGLTVAEQCRNWILYLPAQ